MAQRLEADTTTDRARPVIAALTVTALFSWGLGFYGLGFYLVQLQEVGDWTLGQISTLTLAFHLLATVLGFVVGAALRRSDGRVVFTIGALGLAGGTIAMSAATSLWHLALAYLALSVGWAFTSMNPISATVVAWYEDRSATPLAIALTGASAGGIVLLPLLVGLEQRFGLRTTVRIVGTLELVVVGALATFVIRKPYTPRRLAEPSPSRARDLLVRRDFWLLSTGLAMAIAVQVGMLVHQLNLLTRTVSASAAASMVMATTAAAFVGRFVFIAVQRRIDAGPTGLGFIAVQVVALVALGAVPHGTVLLVATSVGFGFGVGVLITLPALLTRATLSDVEFTAAFPTVNAVYQLGVAAGAPMLAVLHDRFDGYPRAVLVFAILDLAALGLLIVSVRAPKP